jgi:serine/threonine protein kinase
VTRLSTSALEHLRQIAELPDLSPTRYTIIELLGRGGMGAVYRARDGELERDVALKVLVPGITSADMCARLLREARILAQLEHPGIVPVHDVGRTGDGHPFYTMKLVQGARLDQHIGPDTDLAERLRIIDQACEAVAFAHARGIVHRDLKPANIMVGPFGEVLIMDWGIARCTEGDGGGDDVGIDRAGSQVGTGRAGTPGFMAPEQLTGDSSLADERTDVYGLGGVLNFVLTGVATPPSLAAIVARAKALNPAHRYPQVSDLRADLARFRSGNAVAAYRESLVERSHRFVSRYRVPLGLVVAYVLMRLLLLLLAGN